MHRKICVSTIHFRVSQRADPAQRLRGIDAVFAFRVLSAGLGTGCRREDDAADCGCPADLQPVMPILAQEYERQTGVKLDVSFGSSSTLATQILNGAPFDCFFGADFVFPEKVVAGGTVRQRSPGSLCEGHAGALGEAGSGGSAQHGRC